MSLETVSTKRNRVYPRAFDHDEARALRESDPKRWTYPALAAHFGVSQSAIARVLNPATNERMAAQALKHQRGKRTPCKGGCGALVWNAVPGRSGLCPACIGAQRAADGVRDGELLCRSCGEWKADDKFLGKGPKGRRGRKSHCRACGAARRRAWRQAHLEQERAADRERKRRKAAER